MLKRQGSKAAWTAALLGAAGLILTGCQNESTSEIASGGKRVLAEPEVLVPAEPEWYSELPAEDEKIYATANAVSPDRQMAEKIAGREARVALARHLEVMVNGLQRGFEEQLTLQGDFELLQSSQEVAETVTHTTLVGSRVDKKETHLTPKGNYRVFVRMELDRDLVRQNYLDEVRKYQELETRLRASDAFKEMERRVEDYRREEQERMENLEY
jgi:hypothetical protein